MLPAFKMPFFIEAVKRQTEKESGGFTVFDKSFAEHNPVK